MWIVSVNRDDGGAPRPGGTRQLGSSVIATISPRARAQARGRAGETRTSPPVAKHDDVPAASKLDRQPRPLPSTMMTSAPSARAWGSTESSAIRIAGHARVVAMTDGKEISAYPRPRSEALQTVSATGEPMGFVP